MSDQGEDMAERRPLPERALLSVEYPGYVVNADKAIRSIGGSKKLARDATEDIGMPVELRYRYDDPASHPINGKIIPTEDLLLKVTRRIRRSRERGTEPSSENVQVRAEVVAVLDKTVRFRKLSDFQYIVPRNDAITQFSSLVNGIDIDAIKRLGASSVLDDPLDATAGYIPAPFIDRRGWPAQYQPAAGGGTGNDGSQPMDEARRRRDTTKQVFHGVYIKFDAASVPIHASPAAEQERQSIPADVLEKAQRILAESPVVSRNAMELLLPQSECSGLKLTTIMPALAYLMESGPWRGCWIRFGYDPRKDPDACKYQIMDIRHASVGASGGRIRLNPRSGAGQPQPDDAPRSGARARTYIYDDDAVRQKAAGIFQFMHVKVEPLRGLIDYANGRRRVPCEYSGWLQPSVMRTMRLKLRAMKRNSCGVLQGTDELAVDYAELDKAINADRKAEAEALAAEQLIEAREASSAHGQLSRTVRERVDARVDEFMKALGVQDGTDPLNEATSDGDAEDGVDAYADEFDIFGYDDASDDDGQQPYQPE
ncbi:tau 95 subunit of transcription factor TFIIIC [Coemansia biformis]|uniref:Tau 95 subunit of transcription factor TFIIIC n=1 Tax=Coemansia biformis TaxID=1286918 RepID=A0A9W8CVV1_9FUNG|nr:tau 95 subunit of transcription factor TFIIIC [Coemansia biformis]